MANFTIRLDESRRRRALEQAKKLDIPLTLVVKTALENFVKNPIIIINGKDIIESAVSMKRELDKLELLLARRN
ncbi:MAG: hypothetical protein Q8P68_00465 [Candidatus Peregrinibacteria bacterium]|nr:hypothetical protein [Candidatus Peregrinibacteria bacterium]MDZ4245175.1 hypothetical protein [Candidatus Gracilibacteria bacterium]